MKTDRRKFNHTPRTPAKVGEVRTRQRYNTVQRVIKIADSPARWIGYARYLYEQEHGPVSRGQRVIHLDGDPENCHLSNLKAVTPADAIYLWHEANPELSKDNFRKLRNATARHNRKRGRERRLKGVCLSMWYPVEHPRGGTQGAIHLAPRRKRYQVYAAIGIDVGVHRNGAGADAAALGWPGLPAMGAMILAALADGYGAEAVTARVAWLRRERDYPRIQTESGWAQYLSKLRIAGLIEGGRRDYRITEKALSMRSAKWTRAVPIRGYELARECAGYRRAQCERGLEIVR